MWLFYYFNFERNYDVLKSKSPCILLNKNINVNKNKTESKWKIPRKVLKKRILCFSSYKNRKLKVKLWWVGARERKKRAFFVPFILSEGNFFNICVLSQCKVYWIHFQNIHTFTYQITLLHTLFCLLLNSSKAFTVFLIGKYGQAKKTISSNETFPGNKILLEIGEKFECYNQWQKLLRLAAIS